MSPFEPKVSSVELRRLAKDELKPVGEFSSCSTFQCLRTRAIFENNLLATHEGLMLMKAGLKIHREHLHNLKKLEDN